MKLKSQLMIVAVGMILLMASYSALAQDASAGGSRDDCKQKAADTIANLDKWINEYQRQMENSEEVQKAKFEEWIQELNKLKTFVEGAAAKLDDQEGCASEECVGDQCSLVETAGQQLVELIKETESELGSDARFGEQTGRETLLDDETLGDDEILDTHDPYDAQQDGYSDRSGNSDNQSGGLVGNVFETEDTNDNLPPENPKDEASTL